MVNSFICCYVIVMPPTRDQPYFCCMKRIDKSYKSKNPGIASPNSAIEDEINNSQKNNFTNINRIPINCVKFSENIF